MQQKGMSMKRSSYFLITLICCPVINQTLDQATINSLKTVAGLVSGSVSVSGGLYANKLNKQYEKENKKPDTHMRLFKAGAMIAAATSYHAVNLYTNKELPQG